MSNGAQFVPIGFQLPEKIDILQTLQKYYLLKNHTAYLICNIHVFPAAIVGINEVTLPCPTFIWVVQALRWQPWSCCHLRARLLKLNGNSHNWPLDGNLSSGHRNFRLCSHALGKSNVFIEEFSLYFTLVYMVDEEYKQISKQLILWVKLISHILTVKNNKLIRSH